MKYLIPFNESVDTSSKEFKKWFGNSIVTEDHHDDLIKKYNPELIGKPKRVFHKTKQRFSKFDESKDSGENILGKGFYFANTADILGNKVGFDFGDPTIDAYLKLENPLDMNKKLSKSEAIKFIENWSKFAGVTIEKEVDWRDEEKGLTWKNTLANNYGYLIQDSLDWSHEYYDIGENPIYNSIKPFLQSLGYDGFYHYCDSKTDYVNGKTDYTTYVVYSDEQIKRAGLL